MEVIDGLAAVFADADRHAIAFGEAFVARDLRSGPEQVTDQRLVAFFSVRKRCDVFARHDQHMHRRLRNDVEKCVALVVLVDGCGGNASIDDLAKETAHGETSVQDALVPHECQSAPGYQRLPISRLRKSSVVAMSMHVQAIAIAPSTSALSASGVMQCAVNSGWWLTAGKELMPTMG